MPVQFPIQKNWVGGGIRGGGGGEEPGRNGKMEAKEKRIDAFAQFSLPSIRKTTINQPEVTQ
jgi:hypothetical protein